MTKICLNWAGQVGTQGPLASRQPHFNGRTPAEIATSVGDPAHITQVGEDGGIGEIGRLPSLRPHHNLGGMAETCRLLIHPSINRVPAVDVRAGAEGERALRCAFRRVERKCDLAGARTASAH